MVFITSPWKDEQQDSKVTRLMDDLHKFGCTVKSDKTLHYCEHNNLSEMMYDDINRAEKVIIILPESYKDKSDSLTDGIGNEYRNIISGMYKNGNKYILLIFANDSLKTASTDFKGREIININLDDPEPGRYMKLLPCLFH